MIPRYLRMMVVPAGQNLDPEVTPPESAADPRVIGFALLAAGLCAAAWRLRRSPPAVLGAVRGCTASHTKSQPNSSNIPST